VTLSMVIIIFFITYFKTESVIARENPYVNVYEYNLTLESEMSISS